MVPEILHLWCELYKLNIYGAPGGHFRHTLTHHDLSRCLVVLWSALHHQQEVKFDWTVVGTLGTSNLIMYRHLYLGWRIATFRPTCPPSIIHHWMHI